MDSSFWLGKCVWDTHVMLWHKFGGSILVFMELRGLQNWMLLFTGVRRPRPSGRSAWPWRPHLIVANSCMDWVSILQIIVPYC
jgi:hypothetical protein